jgi:CheY-like chemotaxis protein
VESSPQILVVDDSEDIRELLQLILEGAGYRVTVAADGSQALAAVRASRPDLVITDISMPGMEGFEFLVSLRSDVSPPLPPVVVCSGFDVAGEEALRLGATRFMPKPIEPAALVRMVQEALSGRQADKAMVAHERAFVEAARARAAAAAAHLFAKLTNEAPTLNRLTPVLAQSVADYFGCAGAAVAFVRNGGIRVDGISAGCVIPVETAFSGNMLFATGVLAAGSSLVITDAASFLAASIGADPRATALGLNFLIAVPLLYENTPIGVIALVDRAPHPFEAEDLTILEGIGQSASDALRLNSSEIWIGYVQPGLFDRMLGAELSILHRERGGLELLLVEMEPAAVTAALQRELVEHGGPRLALCRRDVGTLAIYKRDADAVAARRITATLLSTLVATGAVRASGWVSVVGTRLCPMTEDVVLRLAGLALGQSLSYSQGRVERVVVGGELALESAAPAASPGG